MFCGYKLKFEFNAAHSNVENDVEHVHFHTFTVVLYLNDLNDRMDYFYEIEKNINAWLAPFEDCNLYETELFKGKSTTLENIGNTFYDAWHEKLAAMGFELVRLDIFENPIRMYSVSEKILDADVNEISALPYAFYDTVNFENQEEKLPSENKAEVLPAVSETAADMMQETAAGTASSVRVSREECVKAEPETEWNHKEKAEKGSDAFLCGEPVAALSLRQWLFTGIYVLCTVALAAAVVMLLKTYGAYPGGDDTYCHLYRADLILHQIENGNWFPLYDPYWYNGVEIMRYWGPVPLYVLAFTQWAGGSVFSGYLGYVGLLFILGAVGWLAFGRRLNRIHMGMFVGVIWFFLPENMKVIFYDGNMPRALINALLPFMICFIWDLLKQKKPGNVLKLTLLFTVISLCHIGTTIMLVAVLLIYLLIYAKVNKSFRSVGSVLACVITGILLSGIWLAASLHGSGAGGSGSNQIMERFFQNAFLSLNPLPAWRGQTLFYFGLSLFLLCLLGCILGSKKTLPGFGVGLIIFFLTTNSAYDILSKLPFSSYLWMMRFVSMALAFVMAAFLLWKGLKKPVLLLFCLILLIDCVPTVRYIYSGEANTVSVELKNQKRGDKLLLNQAKEITHQRMAVFDLSRYGAFAPYYAAGVDRRVKYLFGAGWEGARTANNIVMVNTALENGRYEYIFDRCIELGTDTIVFVISQLQNENSDLEVLREAGSKFGYQQAAIGEETVLFHKDTPESFGVVTDYPYLAIGGAADEIALLYPAFEEGISDNLSDYTYEQLASYDMIYLADFAYESRKETEKLLEKLANSGVKIYIDMNKVPVDPQTNLQELFGVSVQSITFSNGFPVMCYEGEKYKTAGFPEEYKEWKANYLIGLKETAGYGDINNKKLAFCGTAEIPNITFLGYNFVYYTELSGDEAAEKLLNEILGIQTGDFPDRKIVPLDVQYQRNKIIITSTEENVNTTLADIPDIFASQDAYETRQHLICVKEGTTTILIHYPYIIQGFLVTILGLLLFMVLLIDSGRNRHREEKLRSEAL